MERTPSKLTRIDTQVSQDDSSVELTRSASQSWTSPDGNHTRRSSFSSVQMQSPRSEPTVGDLKDIELQRVVADEVPHGRISAKPDPFADWKCAWGFTGKVDESSPIPDTKTEFVQAVQSEKSAASWIQDSLTAYIDAIHSGQHHTFSPDFLADETAAADKTLRQLDQVKAHLDEVLVEVDHPSHKNNNNDDDKDGSKNDWVHDDLKIAFGHARPWIQRTRQISVSNHVFYKINYVLCSTGAKTHTPVPRAQFDRARDDAVNGGGCAEKDMV